MLYDLGIVAAGAMGVYCTSISHFITSSDAYPCIGLYRGYRDYHGIYVSRTIILQRIIDCSSNTRIIIMRRACFVDDTAIGRHPAAEVEITTKGTI